jgi:AcrR family transcriptional regulator
MNNKVSTYDKIIAASIDLFHKNGYAGTTLQDISKDSGAAIGSIYHAFPNGKTDIAKSIDTRYQIENNKTLGDILKLNAVDSTIEQIIDSLIAALVELGQKYPCYYDQAFLSELETVCKDANPQENEILNYTTILFQIKYPNLTKQEAELKAKICNNIWGSLILEYDQTQDPQTLEQLKIITLRYLQD